MKKILLFLACLWSVCHAQRGDVQKVQTIIQLKAYNGTAPFVYVADSATYFSTCSPCTADEITIFAGTGSRKWKAHDKGAVAFDTTNVFIEYQDAINDRVKYVDTAAMLAAYASGLLDRVNKSDTATVLAAYRTAINARLKYTDTTAALAAYQIALNARLKYTDTVAALAAYQAAINLRLKYTDTTALLAAYQAAINGRLKYTDTATMLAAYQAALNERIKISDSATLLASYQTAINARLKIADTATMLSAYQTALNNITAILVTRPREVLRSNVQTRHTGNLTETTIYTGTIPAGTLTANGSVHFILATSWTSSANAKTVRLKVNGTTIATFSNGTATYVSARWFVEMSNRNSLTSQVIPGPVGGHNATSSLGATTQAFNTAADLTITITALTTNTGEEVGYEKFQAIVFP